MRTLRAGLQRVCLRNRYAARTTHHDARTISRAERTVAFGVFGPANRRVVAGAAILGMIAFASTTLKAQTRLLSAGKRVTLTQPNADPAQAHIRSTFATDGAYDHQTSWKAAGGDPPAVDESAGMVRFQDGSSATPSSPVATAGGPSNQFCGNATVIPGNVTLYNPSTYSTSGALTSLCNPQESCDGTAGTSRSVYYSYTPALPGLIEVNTFGSSYDTVLSIFDNCADSCPGVLCCTQPNELTCNDNASFGTQSQVYLDVVPGQTYLIKAAALGFSAPGGTLNFNFKWIPPHNLCGNALPINGLFYASPPFNTTTATPDLCEAQESCEFNGVGSSNSVFYSFTPPCDGTISMNTNGSDYDTVLSIWDGCGQFIDPDAPCDLPNEIACDDDAGIGLLSQLVDIPVQANQEYVIKVADYNATNGGGVLSFNFIFDGAAPPVAEITSPAALTCVCDVVNITGSAYDSDGGFGGYVVEYQPANGGPWTLINSSAQEIVDSTLAIWNTSGLASGYYNVRVAVGDACGNFAVDTRVVWVDDSFGNLEVRAPDEGGVYGGIVCVDGTAWDQCFDNYTIDFTETGGERLQPIDPEHEAYTTPVINDPLGYWSTPDVDDGTYDIHVTAVDDCGHAQTEIVKVIIDNTPPVSEITDPEKCTCFEGVVDIYGTAFDEHFDRWVLQFAGTGDGWTTIAQGTDPVVQDYLASWNVSELPACSYALRLLTYSEAIINCDDKTFTEFVIGVEVGCEDVNFDSDGDGDVDIDDYDAFQNAFTGP